MAVLGHVAVHIRHLAIVKSKALTLAPQHVTTVFAAEELALLGVQGMRWHFRTEGRGLRLEGSVGFLLTETAICSVAIRRGLAALSVVVRLSSAVERDMLRVAWTSERKRLIYHALYKAIQNMSHNSALKEHGYFFKEVFGWVMSDWRSRSCAFYKDVLGVG